jgi:nucleotide-binding universal stress UspA family protein
MGPKDIFVCLDPTDAGEARLRLAAALAREHHAHLSAALLLSESIPGAPPRTAGGVIPPTGAAWMPQAGLVAGLPAQGATPGIGTYAAAELEIADIVEQRFRAEVEPHSIAGDWHQFGSGDSAEFVALLTAVDLVVLGQTSEDYRLPPGFRPENVIVGSGRPVLVAPYAGEFNAIGRRVLIAWDSSREAARALHDALPLIAKAEAAIVVGVSSREAQAERAHPSLERIVRHLGLYGIPARFEEIVGNDVPVAELLLSRAADLDADLIIAGAYHHSQFREALVGGVSRGLLDHMTVPVLMSH